MTSAAFWRGRRVFLTGHTGFKGSWLALWLQRLGAEVTGFALAPATRPAMFAVADVASGMRSVIGDIRDRPALEAALRTAAPEVVLHLAAQPLVRRAYADPTETYGTNVMGLVHLFESVRAVGGVRALVNVTSDKCYDNRTQPVGGHAESAAMGGLDPYSSSKGCAELITSSYRASFFEVGPPAARTALASARAGNVIGGGDWSADRLIPDILRAIEAGRPVRIRQPTAVRPWQHVLEPLSGYLELARRLVLDGEAFADGWNFGPAARDARPVAWIVERLIAARGDGAHWERDPVPGPHEAHHLTLDCSKAARHLGWHPIWGLDVALEKIADWHRAHDAGADMRAVTLAQIADFERDRADTTA